jgi:membrane protease YdiL (CAAX protease family)
VKRFRVWIALAALPLLLGVVFFTFAAFLGNTLQPLAAVPGSIGFTAGFLLTRHLASKDGLSLGDLGWRRPTGPDLAVGLGAAALFWAINAFALHPLLQSAQPSFDPTLGSLSLPAATGLLLTAVVAEDTLYRGYALHVLKGRHGTVAALAITTACYALLAPGPGFALRLWSIYFGAVLGALRLWRRNLWPVAITHGLVALGPRLLA